jgi:hypothetical protein
MKGTAVGVWPGLHSGYLLGSREGGNRAGLEGAIAKPVPPMLLVMSDPHDSRPINIISAWILVWPLDRPCLRCIGADAGVGARVAVRLGRVIRAKGDIRSRLSLVSQSIRHERGQRLATMRHQL